MPTGIGVSVSPVLSGSGESGGYTPVTGDFLLMESGDFLLLETGFKILLES